MKLFAPFLLAVPLAFGFHAYAQHQTFTIAPDASSVAFSLSGSEHSTHGSFHVRDGSIDFDRTAGIISGSVDVAAGSGNSGNQSRDKKMTNEVLDATHFADISFVPHSYQGTIAPSGDSAIQVTGTFTLHGASHEITVPMQVHIDGIRCVAKAHFTIPYVNWGLKDPSVFILKVAKDVDIDLTLAGNLSSAG